MSETTLKRSPIYRSFSVTAILADGLNSTEAIACESYTEGTFQIVHATHTDTSTWELQVSLDGGTNWDTIAGSSITTSGAAGSTAIHYDSLPVGLIRLTVTEADANVASTLTLYAGLRR